MSRVDPLHNPEPLIERVYAYVAYRIGPGPEAEDVVSATFERALKYRASYDKNLGEAVARLTDRERELIALRYGADLTARSIAKLVGASTNAVEVALHRALARLRDELERPSAPEVATLEIASERL